MAKNLDTSEAHLNRICAVLRRLVWCVINSLTYCARSLMLFPMSRPAPAVVLSPEERATLQSWAKARSQPQRLVQRAQVVLMAAEGIKIRRSRRACAFRDQP